MKNASPGIPGSLPPTALQKAVGLRCYSIRLEQQGWELQGSVQSSVRWHLGTLGRHVITVCPGASVWHELPMEAGDARVSLRNTHCCGHRLPFLQRWQNWALVLVVQLCSGCTLGWVCELGWVSTLCWLCMLGCVCVGSDGVGLGVCVLGWICAAGVWRAGGSESFGWRERAGSTALEEHAVGELSGVWSSDGLQSWGRAILSWGWSKPGLSTVCDGRSQSSSSRITNFLIP